MKTFFKNVSVIGPSLAVLLTACGGGGGGMPASEILSDSEGSPDNPVIEQGQFEDIQGITYTSGSQTGTSDSDGSFDYEDDQTVTFLIGDIVIATISPKSFVSFDDLSANADAVYNITRFLRTLDDDANLDNGIQIIEAVRNLGLGESINFEQSATDFSDDGNVQSVVATLTSVTSAGPRALVEITSNEYICPDHTSSQTNIVGNNTYEFLADAGQCFGTTGDLSLLKREVPISLDLSIDDGELISLSPTGKLTVNSLYLYLTFSVTNNSALPMCIDFDSGGTVIREGENDIESLSPDLLGDVFYNSRFNFSNRYRQNCIPAGETREAWASRAGRYSAEEFGLVDDVIVGLGIEVHEPSAFETQRFIDPITPSEAEWRDRSRTILGNDYYGYEIVNSFTNNGSDVVDLRNDIFDILYFDEAGYLVFASLTSVWQFLGVDDPFDVTRDDLMMQPFGGSVSTLQGYYPVIGSSTISSRANKIVINFEYLQID